MPSRLGRRAEAPRPSRRISWSAYSPTEPSTSWGSMPASSRAPSAPSSVIEALSWPGSCRACAVLKAPTTATPANGWLTARSPLAHLPPGRGARGRRFVQLRCDPPTQLLLRHLPGGADRQRVLVGHLLGMLV